MWKSTFFGAVLFAASVGNAAEVERQFKALVANSDQQKEHVLKNLATDIDLFTSRLKRAKRGIVTAQVKEVLIPEDEKRPIKYPSAKVKKEKVAELEAAIQSKRAKLDGIKSGKVFHLPLLGRPLGVGDCGIIIGQLEVAQVLDEKSFRGEVALYPKVLDGTVPLELAQTPVIVEGFPTAELADGQVIDVPGVWYCSKNKTYETVIGGTKTVLVLEAVQIEDLKKFLADKGMTLE